jgi:3-hydroxyisobutyrate dehydrogenase
MDSRKEAPHMTKIGFIGIGNMGRPMALNLHKAGFSVQVFDVSAAAMAEASKEGMRVAASIVDCVTDVDFVVTMLPSGKHVEELYLGKKGILETVRAGTVLIDSSTIAPVTAQKVGKAAVATNPGKKLEILDAPVSGGTGGAMAGTLTFMVGGNAETFAKAKPILEKMGKNIFHCGESGTGQITKICNNMLLAIHMIGTSEAINLGRNAGIDPKTLSAVMAQSSGRNWSLEVYNPLPGVMENSAATRGYTGGFAVDLMAKDLVLAQEAALQTQTATPLGKVALDLYRMQSRAGKGGLDFSSIIQFLQPEA